MDQRVNVNAPLPAKTAQVRGVRRVWLATLNSKRSFSWLLRNEAAFRQELGMLAVFLSLTIATVVWGTILFFR